MTRKIDGRVWKLGDNIDTDTIISARYLALKSIDEMSLHIFEAILATGQRSFRDVLIVAGENFGCGSSREQATRVIKEVGIKAVIADSLARIFFRNAINCGLIAVECPGISSLVQDEDYIELKPVVGRIRLPGNRTCECLPLPEFLLDIVGSGGLIPYLKR